MDKQQHKTAPVHHFSTLSDIRFSFITINEANFEVPDVAHRHRHWSIFIFMEGNGKHTIDFSTIDTAPGSIHFVLPGQLHALDGREGFLAHVLLFTEEFFLLKDETKNLLMKLFSYMDSGEPPVLHLNADDKEYMHHLLHLMQQENKTKSQSRDQILLDLLSVFVNKCMQAMNIPLMPMHSAEAQQYLDFRTEVEKNYRHIHSVAEYAQRLSLSTKAINDVTRQFAGMSALEFIHQRIFTETKRMLRYSQKPIKQIAYDLDFSDTAHFTKFFKQKAGIPPLEYRNSQ
ncbi:MAG: helix-turn-helix domain-containing protein [Bacteroidetes bacterium]|nr:helix-turn-helix domain-containing protein [Bacteroidota bacterium]